MYAYIIDIYCYSEGENGIGLEAAEGLLSKKWSGLGERVERIPLSLFCLLEHLRC